MRNMALKLSWYFYLLMKKPLSCYLQIRSPYYVAQCNLKTPTPVSSRWQVRSGKTKKGYTSILITATTRVHLPKHVSTDLTIKSDLVLTNSIRKDGGVKLVGVIKHLPHEAFLLWYTCKSPWNLGKMWSILVSYEFGRCSSELPELIPLFNSCFRSTQY